MNRNVKNVFKEPRNFKYFIYIYLYLCYRDNVYRYVLIEKHDVYLYTSKMDMLNSVAINSHKCYFNEPILLCQNTI